MANWDFLVGFLSGFLAAGIMGFLLQKVRLARKKMGSYQQPQTVGHKTDKTPLQVIKESIAACLSCVVWTLVLIVVAAAIVAAVTWMAEL